MVLEKKENFQIYYFSYPAKKSRPYLVIKVVFVDVVFVNIEFEEDSNSIHLNRLQLSCLEPSLFIVWQRNISKINIKKD